MLSEWRGLTASCFGPWIAARAHREEADGHSNQQEDFQWKTPFRAWKICKPRPGEQDTSAKMSQVFSLLKTKSSVPTRVPDYSPFQEQLQGRWVHTGSSACGWRYRTRSGVGICDPTAQFGNKCAKDQCLSPTLCTPESTVSPRTHHRSAQLMLYWREQAPQGRVQ